MSVSQQNNNKLQKLEKKMDTALKSLSSLREDFDEHKDKIQLLVNIFDTAKHSAAFFVYLGRFVRWLISLIILLTFIYGAVMAVKHGLPMPTIPGSILGDM